MFEGGNPSIREALANEQKGSGSVVAIRQEYKKLKALMDYWQGICRPGGLPSRSDLDPVEIPQLLGNVFLVDVERQPMRFRMRLAGSEIDRVFGRSFTGRFLDDFHTGYFERDALSDYAQVVFCKQPSFTERCVAGAGGQWIHYRRLLLPLSTDGWQVDMLLGGVDFAEAGAIPAAAVTLQAG